MAGNDLRTGVKRVLAAAATADRRPAQGATVLLYHRVGGGTSDELDLPVDAFEAQLDALSGHRVVALDSAVDRLAAGDDGPAVVLTFDDGWADLHEHAWPRLRDRGLHFTVYLATAYLGGRFSWGGATGPALRWEQVEEMVASGLCTVGNHTHSHVPPTELSIEEVDRCSDAIQAALGARPQHFAYPWGVEVPRMRGALAERFRSVATGVVGRNRVRDDVLSLRRVPVRRTDPLPFFRAKLAGGLIPERVYGALVSSAKRVGARG